MSKKKGATAADKLLDETMSEGGMKCEFRSFCEMRYPNPNDECYMQNASANCQVYPFVKDIFEAGQEFAEKKWREKERERAEISFSHEEVLKIIDACFHMFASSYRVGAKEHAETLINKKIENIKKGGE